MRTGRDEVGEHDVEAVDGLGAGADQVVAVFDDRAQGRDGLVDRGGIQRVALRAAIATLTASASSFLRPWPVESIRPGRRAWPVHR